MILKSFEVEKNIKILLKYQIMLIYGENIGLKESFKEKIISLFKDAEIVNLYNEDISKNKDIIINEAKNISLFTKNKVIIFNQASDKVLSDIQYILKNEKQTKIILFADILEKKSKLRSFFEKEKTIALIPCYSDNEITLRRLVQSELKDYKNLNNDVVTMVINYSNLDRKNIMSNLEKIKIYFEKRILSQNELETLLNTDRNEFFENIRDAALNGEKSRLNSLFDNFVFNKEETFLYLNAINQRLIKIKEIQDQNVMHNNLELALNKMRPPIFWKDKPTYMKLLKKWDKKRVLEAIIYLGKIEKEIKNNSSIDQVAIVRNSITNICSNSWTYF